MHVQIRLLFFGVLLTLNGVCYSEIEFFPDFENPDIKWTNEADVETGYPNQDYALRRFAEYLRDRQRLHHVQQLMEEGDQMVDRQRKPVFTYRFPENPPAINTKPSRPFGVDPSDPRYYLKTPIIPDYVPEDGSNKISNDDLELTTSTTVSPSYQRKLYYNGDLIRNGDPIHNGVRIVPATISVEREKEAAGLYIIAVVAGISAAATVGLIVFGIGYYNLQKNAKAAADVEYPAYGVTGPHKDVSPSSGDRRLAQSAHMYHYQHQKQQIIAMERAANDRHGSMSEADSDEENEEGDYTVYECPGLAPTGEMEVKNPLFQDDPTPATGTQDKQCVTPIPDLK